MLPIENRNRAENKFRYFLFGSDKMIQHYKNYIWIEKLHQNSYEVEKFKNYKIETINLCP